MNDVETVMTSDVAVAVVPLLREVPREPVESVVHFLEKLLEAAKRGELVGFASVLAYTEGRYGRSMVVNDRVEISRMLGETCVLRRSLENIAIEIEEESYPHE